ncbi:MAG: hypothetical protein QNJ54_10195 [Prochloraceae cyanobacterium]|nr:hypothetical protein [Prochloraceae cyanobacterium]
MNSERVEEIKSSTKEYRIQIISPHFLTKRQKKSPTFSGGMNLVWIDSSERPNNINNLFLITRQYRSKPVNVVGFSFGNTLMNNYYKNLALSEKRRSNSE